MPVPPADISGSVSVSESIEETIGETAWESVVELTLRAALDVSPDGFAVHRVRRGPDGRAAGFTLEAINSAGAAPHSAGLADLLGRDLVDLLPDCEATGIPAAFRAAADTGVVQTLRTGFASDDWSGVMDLLVARIDRDRIVATWRDVTDLVRSEQVLVEAYTRAQAAWDCLYGVLDAVEDAVLLLRVGPDTPTVEGMGPPIPDQVTGWSRTGRRPSPVVEYLNAAAAGTRDRAVLCGRDLTEVRPDLDLDAVLELVTAAATDRPGCLRRLVLSTADGLELASFTASPAPAVIEPATHAGPATRADASTRNVVLVVRKPPQHD